MKLLNVELTNYNTIYCTLDLYKFYTITLKITKKKIIKQEFRSYLKKYREKKIVLIKMNSRHQMFTLFSLYLWLKIRNSNNLFCFIKLSRIYLFMTHYFLIKNTEIV